MQKHQDDFNASSTKLKSAKGWNRIKLAGGYAARSIGRSIRSKITGEKYV